MNAEFQGQTKTKLGNAEARSAVEKAVMTELSRIFDKQSSLLNALFKKVHATKQANDAAKLTKDMIRDKHSSLIASALPTKLSDCTMNDCEKTELFIVEGESAAGNAKQVSFYIT